MFGRRSDLGPNGAKEDFVTGVLKVKSEFQCHGASGNKSRYSTVIRRWCCARQVSRIVMDNRRVVGCRHLRESSLRDKAARVRNFVTNDDLLDLHVRRQTQ